MSVATNNSKSAAKQNLKDVELSKKLSWLLRHGALKEGLSLQSDGYVSVPSILQHPKFRHDFSQAILERLVANDSKQRYSLRHNTTTGAYEIRANQGHSLKEVLSEECMERITSAEVIPMAVHGTYYSHWTQIRKEGLRRMTRNHVHFAIFDCPRPVISGKSSDNDGSNAVSGFRNACQLLIYLDINKVLADNRMALYRSSNGVVLCTGIGDAGQIPVEYFAKVVDRKTGALLEY